MTIYDNLDYEFNTLFEDETYIMSEVKKSDYPLYKGIAYTMLTEIGFPDDIEVSDYDFLISTTCRVNSISDALNIDNPQEYLGNNEKQINIIMDNLDKVLDFKIDIPDEPQAMLNETPTLSFYHDALSNISITMLEQDINRNKDVKLKFMEEAERDYHESYGEKLQDVSKIHIHVKRLAIGKEDLAERTLQQARQSNNMAHYINTVIPVYLVDNNLLDYRFDYRAGAGFGMKEIARNFSEQDLREYIRQNDDRFKEKVRAYYRDMPDIEQRDLFDGEHVAFENVDINKLNVDIVNLKYHNIERVAETYRTYQRGKRLDVNELYQHMLDKNLVKYDVVIK